MVQQIYRGKKLKQADLRSIFTGQDVVYIYHNQIDARGDKAASENEVFTACEEAIEEIYSMIKKIASQANTLHFIVTADHGFIYKRDKIQATDKISGAASQAAGADPWGAGIHQAAVPDDFNVARGVCDFAGAGMADIRSLTVENRNMSYL